MAHGGEAHTGALELGAVDFIAKPTKRASMELRNIEKDLLLKTRGAREVRMDVLNNNLKLHKALSRIPAKSASTVPGVKAVVIGTSTGGPPALRLILSRLPSDFPCPVIVGQHMLRGYTKPLAQRLDKITGLNVKEAKNGEAVEKGKVLICPGGYHMTFIKTSGGMQTVLEAAGYKDRYVPSIDRMMSSAVKCFGKNMVGVVLTGMGNDGLEGMVEIKSKGGYTIAESEKTAVVFGMPKEVIRAGAAHKVLNIEKISEEIIHAAMRRRGVDGK
jgi:two-component system chemotaxis response regulator CheB